MKKLLLLITIISISVTGCKKDPCKDVDCFNGGTCDNGTCACPEGYEGVNCETEKEEIQEPNFDETKGWTLQQTIRHDYATSNPSLPYRLGYYDMDYSGNNLRVFYYQGWQSQQDFLYTTTRLDEFNADKTLAKRDSLTWPSSFQTEGSSIDKVYLLRNNKTSLIRLSNGSNPAGAHWQFYENGSMVAESNQLYSEQIGFLTSVTDENIFSCGLYNRSDAVLSHFYVNYFNNTSWKTYSYGSISNNTSAILGADFIDGTTYAFLASYKGTDSTTITTFKFDEAQNKWVSAFEQNFPGRPMTIYGGRDYGDNRYYFNNNGVPLVVLKDESDAYSVYKINIQNATITQEGKATLAASNVSMVALNNEIYIGYNTIDGGTLSTPSVSKISGNSLIPIGMPGLTKKSSGINLAVKNNKLHAITYSHTFDKYSEIYIATPQ